MIKILTIIKAIATLPYILYMNQFDCDIDKIMKDELK